MTKEILLPELAQAVDGLIFISETDGLWQTVVWPQPDAPTPDTVRHWQNTPELPAAFDDLARLLRGPTTEHVGLTTAGIARVQRYRYLKQLLEQHLTDLRVIRVGHIALTVYIFGRAPDGTWLGLKTSATET